MSGGQKAIDAITCQGIGGIASVAFGTMSANKGKMNVPDMVNVPLDPRVVASLPQGPIEFTSEGNTFRIVLRDAQISINGLPVIRFGIITALHGKQPSIQVLSACTDAPSLIYYAGVPAHITALPHSWCHLASLCTSWVPCQREQE